MNINSILEDTKNSIELYIESLKNYTDEEMIFKNDEQTWSLSQMLHHLYTSSNYYFLGNALRCIENRKGQEGGEKTENGAKMIEKNSFPPIKIKAPAGVQPENNAFSVQKYEEYFQNILSDAQKLANLAHENGTYKVEGFMVGWLNGTEWLQLHAMHLRHHLKQKQELEAHYKASKG